MIAKFDNVRPDQLIRFLEFLYSDENIFAIKDLPERVELPLNAGSDDPFVEREKACLSWYEKKSSEPPKMMLSVPVILLRRQSFDQENSLHYCGEEQGQGDRRTVSGHLFKVEVEVPKLFTLYADYKRNRCGWFEVPSRYIESVVKILGG
jgi:hypothetical protein